MEKVMTLTGRTLAGAISVHCKKSANLYKAHLGIQINKVRFF